LKKKSPLYDNNQQLLNKQKLQTVAMFVQLSLKKECEKKIAISTYNQKKCCSQKEFLTQLWHQKICRTELWQKSIWENLRVTNLTKTKIYNC